MSTAVFLLLLGAVGVNVVITFRNAYVQELLTVGWGPLFIAMAISRCAPRSCCLVTADPPLLAVDPAWCSRPTSTPSTGSASLLQS